MITVLAKLPIQPDLREKFATGIVPTILGRKPDGNLSVECFESVASPGDFLLKTVWESEEAQQAWQRSDVFQDAVAELADFLAGPWVVQRFAPVAVA